MSLVTLDINEVADVIDEAITRHVLVSHNNSKSNTFINDILSFRSELQKLDEYVHGLDYNSDIESVKIEISKLDEKLSSFGIFVDDISKYKTDIDTKLIDHADVGEVRSLSQEIEIIKNNIQERYADVTKGVEVELSNLRERLDKFVDNIDKKFDEYLTTKESLLLSQEIKEVKDDIQEHVLEELGDIRLCLESFVKQEINNLPVPKDGKDGVSIDFENIKSFILEEISKIPTPQDGKSIDIDVVLSFVKEQIDKIPIPRDGIDGISVDIDEIKSFISDEISKIPTPKDGISVDQESILSFIREEVSKIPVPKDGQNGVDGLPGLDGKNGRDGIDGKNGLDGINGKDGASIDDVEDFINTVVVKAISEIPTPKDGTSVSLDDVKPFIVESIDSIPRPKDGIDGVSVSLDDLKSFVVETVSKIPPAKDGISVTLDDVKPVILDAVQSIPVPKDGKDAEVDWGRIEIAMRDQIKSILDQESRNKEYTPEEIPENIAEKVSKAISIVAESSIIPHQQPIQPIVVNVTQSEKTAAQNNSASKRIVAHRNSDGTLSANVMSVDKKVTMKKDKDGNFIIDMDNSRE